MLNQWLWLEDQPETVADFKAAIDTKVLVKIVTTPADLIRSLLSIDPDQRSSIGLILDVMLIHNPLLTCPPDWHANGDKAVFFKTRMGYDAGLVLYEKFMLPNEIVKQPPLYPPPPVIFLTVVKHDLQNLEPRFTALRESWANLHRVDVNQGRVEWARKWDANGKGLLKILKSWEETSA